MLSRNYQFAEKEPSRGAEPFKARQPCNVVDPGNKKGGPKIARNSAKAYGGG